MPFFLQGCCGNINPHPRGTFEKAEQHGRTLGGAALDALEQDEPAFPVAGVGAKSRVVELPLLAPPPIGICESRIAEWERKLEVERTSGDVGHILHAEGMLAFARYEREKALEGEPALRSQFEIQMLDVGGATVLGMPGEMFVQYQVDFERQSDGIVFPLGYTNGVHGYVPTAADYPFGGYEVEGAHRYYGTLMYAAESEALIRQAGYELLGVADPDRTPYTI